MAKTQVLQFFINLPDKELVDTLNAEMDAGGGPTVNPHGSILVWGGLPNGLGVAPYNPSGPSGAAVTANVLAGLSGAAPVIEVGDTMASPSVSSSWFTGGANFPLDVATFTRKSGGWFGIPLLFGTTTRFYWSGRFQYVPIASDVADPADTANVAPIPTVQWLASFEGVPADECLTSVAAGPFPTAFDMRLPTGRRGRVQSENQGSAPSGSGTVSRGTSGPQTHWDRIYWTLIKKPVSLRAAIYGSFCFPQSTAGVGVGILPSGQLFFVMASLSGGMQIVGTTADSLEEGRRYRLDLLTRCATTTVAGSNNASFRVYLDGVLVYNSGNVTTGIGEGGSASGQKLQQINLKALNDSPFAITGSAIDDEYRCVYDAWIGKDIPNIGGVESLTSIDWKTGSLLVPLDATADAASLANWTTGKWRSADNAFPVGIGRVTGVNFATSSTALAVLAYVTNAAQVVSRFPQALGVGGIVTTLLSHRGTTSGRIGFNINGAGMVWEAVTQVASPSPSWNSVVYPGPGTIAPLALASLEIGHEKGNDATAGNVYSFRAIAELIGVFDQCDVLVDEDAEEEAPTAAFVPKSVHNQPFPDSPWADAPLRQSAVFSPFHVVSGTYVGNGTGQDIALKAPPVFVHVRRVTGTGDTSCYLWNSMQGAHIDTDQGIFPEMRVLRNTAFPPAGAEDAQEQGYLLRIATANAQLNTNAATYHYFAICDPGARFFLAEQAITTSAPAADRTDPLQRDDFTPTWAFVFMEDNSTTTSPRLYLKGGGVTAQQIMPVESGTPVAAALEFGDGVYKWNSGLSPFQPNSIGLLFARTVDGGDVPAIPPYAQITYVGDGSASRTISVNLGGKRPLWAIGNSATGGFIRDPSNTSTNSVLLSSGNNNTTGFTGGGIDSVSVGSGLNANGTVYELFIVPGSATAGNNGWSIDGEFWPIEPDYAGADLGDPEIIDNGDGDGGGDGDVPPEQPDLDDETALPGTDLFCLDFTNRLLNMALQKIGVNKRITDAARDTTIEAVCARDFVKQAVEEVLRSHPWDFATEYELYDEPESGTVESPVNRDWTYAYAVPVRLITGRRLVPQQPGVGRKHNPDPQPFRLGLNETTGHKLFTDAEATEDVPLSLEYTKRVGCPTYFGDPLFKEALVWKFAAFFAAGLSRDSAKARWCEQMFMGVLDRAETVDANEQQPEQGTTQNSDPDWLRDRN